MAENQEAVLARLNKLSAPIQSRSLDVYTIGEIVCVKNLKRVNTIYGMRIVMNSGDFSTFLPVKMNEMTDKEILEYNALKNLVMCYMGRVNNLHTITFKQHEIADFYQNFYNAAADV